MAALIKSQILKHLSVFTKNLSADKIQLSTLKGEGQLQDLCLDEQMLMQVLDLPTSLAIVSATCNKIFVRIKWTQLKSQPICLYLDEVQIEMKTLEEPRQHTTNQDQNSTGQYGFAERIIDGILLNINTVIVNFTGPGFSASFQMSHIVVESKTPTWERGSLKMTKIKDEARKEILLFKEVSWQTLRIEANALDNDLSTPLRLIANQSKIRVTLKKRLSDGGLIASRLEINLDDLLWVLTDSQLKAALQFAASLNKVIQKSAEQSKLLAAEKLTKQKSAPLPQDQNADLSKLFNKFDVIETSYHIRTGRIDLHLCDDNIQDVKKKVSDGALQITLSKLSLHHYPYHEAGTPRIHWLRYDENMIARDLWAKDLYRDFKAKVIKVKNAFTDRMTAFDTPAIVARPMESCFILLAENFSIYKVTTATKSGKHTPTKFISSEKCELLLPDEMSAFHIDFTEYYFPDDINYPVPPANIYAIVNPTHVKLHPTTLIWLNAFLLNISEQLVKNLDDIEEVLLHMDVKFTALMPKVFASLEDKPSDDTRPTSLRFSFSRVTLSNSLSDAEIADFNSLLLTLSRRSQHRGLVAPPPHHVYACDFIDSALRLLSVPCRPPPRHGRGYYSMTRDSLKPLASSDYWRVGVDQMWAEFVDDAGSRRGVPFVEPFPVSVYFCRDVQQYKESIQALIDITSKLHLQLTHYQFIFLMRIADILSETLKDISEETKQLTMGSKQKFLHASTTLQEVEIALVTPVENFNHKTQQYTESSSVNSLSNIVSTNCAVYADDLSRVSDSKIFQYENLRSMDSPRGSSHLLNKSPSSLDWECTSLQSSSSEDILRFQNAAELPAFDTKPSPLCQEQTDAASQSDSTSILSANITHIQLKVVDLTLQVDDEDIVVNVDVRDMSLFDTSEVDLEEFRQRFSVVKLQNNTSSSTSQEVKDPPPPEDSQPVIRLAYRLGPDIGKLIRHADTLGFVEILVNSLVLNLQSSSLTLLSSFFNDEQIKESMCIQISLRECSIIIKDDTPPLYTSTVNVPLNVTLENIDININTDHTISIRDCSRSDLDLKITMQQSTIEQLQLENRELLRLLAENTPPAPPTLT